MKSTKKITRKPSSSPAAPRRRAVLILGMHRSGTSALARVLSLRGAELPAEVLPPNEGNPMGYWEPQSIVDFNDGLLAYFGVEWSDPFASAQIPHADAVPAKFYKKAAELVGKEYGDAELFVLKDPRCTLLADFWIRVLEECGVEPCPVAMMRPYLEVADSLRRRDGMSVANAILIYIAYAARCVEFSRRVTTTFVTYGQLLQDWRAATDRIATEHLFEWPKGGATAVSQIEGFLVAPAGRSAGVKRSGAMGEWADRLWTWMECRAADVAVEDVDDVLRGLDAASVMFSPVIAERTLKIARLEAQIGELRGVEEKLHRMFEESQSTLRATAVERDQTLSERDGLLSRENGLRVELEQFRQALAERTEATKKSADTVTEIKRQRDEFESDRNRALEALRALEGQHAETAEALQLRNADVKQLEQARDEFESDRNRALEALRALEGQHAETAEALQLRNADVKRLGQARDEFESDRNRALEALRALEGQHAQLCHMHEDALQKLDVVSARADANKSELDRTKSALEQIYTSRSWAITRPLRGIGRVGRHLAAKPLRALIGNNQLLRLPAPSRAIEFSGRDSVDIEAHIGLANYLEAEFGTDAVRDVISRIEGFKLPVDGSEIRSASRTMCSEQVAVEWASALANQAVSSRLDAHAPVVSVVIPVYNQIRFTLACLDSLLSHRTRYRFEVLIGDDCSTDATASALATPIIGVTHVRHEANLGFVRNCNTTAEKAKGRYVVLLNNDTLVLPGWLDELIGTLERDVEVGLVGSKLVYPDGRLQECGAIVWNDGSAWNLGRFDDPRKPEYCYLRDVDYVSGASIAVRADLWSKLGGFDELFVPAYAEDADLAFRIRGQGLRTVVQPLSQILHFEGVSSGTDTSQGAKAYQIDNLKKLQQRWSSVISTHRANADKPDLEKERATRRRVLFVDHVTPTPHADAGSLVAWEVMAGFRELGYKVTFIPEDNFAHMGSDSADLQRVGVETIYHPSYSFMTDFLEARQDPFDVIFLHRYKVAEAHLHDLRKRFPRARIIFLNADMHFLREMREAELSGDRGALSAARKTRSRELTVVKAVDCTLVHSDFEFEILKEECPTAEVRLFPLIQDPVANPASLSEREGVCFIGGYRHPPNVDAIIWFVSEAWPNVIRARPDAKLYIVGSHAPREVEALGNEPGVEFVGYVEDLEKFLADRRVSVAPLRYGAGAKGKVATSLANGLPSVCTPVAVEGMQLTNGLNVLVGETAEDLALHLIALLGDDAKWKRLAENGLVYADEVTAKRHAHYRIRSALAALGVS